MPQAIAVCRDSKWAQLCTLSWRDACHGVQPHIPLQDESSRVFSWGLRQIALFPQCLRSGDIAFYFFSPPIPGQITCNLYSQTKSQDATRHFIDDMTEEDFENLIVNLQPEAGIFPDYEARIIRQSANGGWAS